MTTSELHRELERIKYYRSRYELVIEHPDGRKYLLCYTDQKSDRGIFSAACNRGERIVRLTGIDNIRKDGHLVHKCGEWTIRFSGRTQRESLIAGELEFLTK